METSSKSQPSLNLVIFDSIDLAGDNGEYLYRQIRSKYPNIKMTFLLSRNSIDWKRLEKDGFNLYPINGQNVDKLMDASDFILFSKSVLSPKTGSRKHKSIFLQHGTINKYQDLTRYFTKTINRSSGYIVCGSTQEGDLIKQMSNNRVGLIQSGMPRHDILLDKWNKIKDKKTIKQIFISFHWRNSSEFMQENSFRRTQYLRDINDILANPQLMKLHARGVKIVFFPHAMFRRYLHLFKIPSYIDVPKNKTFQDILVESDCIVTDFSSNTFEMAYMDKPSFTYVPGIEHVKQNLKHYNINNLSKYPHITYCKTIQTLFDRLFEFIGEQKKNQFAKSLFSHVDQHNSERLVEWMLSHIKKSNSKPTISFKSHYRHPFSTMFSFF